jgi:hypothetical protein
MATAILNVCQLGAIVRLRHLRAHGDVEEYVTNPGGGVCLGA